MRNASVAHLLTLGLAPSLSLAARNCATSSTAATTFQYRILEARYDGPDPAKANNLSTIAVSLGTSATPLYECVVQWPESWAGWYQGGSNIIWSDCIWTGAGNGADKTVSFAVDWAAKNLYLAHTFDCSNKAGTEGLATGVLPLPSIQCNPDPLGSGTTYCTPPPAANGGRLDLRINTKLSNPSSSGPTTCQDASSVYQSWSLESWRRQYEIAPGSFSPKNGTDTGPSFNLRSLALSGVVLSCATEKETASGVFEGACKASGDVAAKTKGTFKFDSVLNMLSVDQVWDCGDGTTLDINGVAYFQATCDRGFNSNLFTCTSAPVWLGTKIV
ncbi:hypothetical protein QBC43DRAFT_288998 [Cladorrhinum sp. PSN259]|nr:hypothetical protein QBC43DRAFT_288998 [Cladorrhinum sp. PSN259]